MYLNYYENKAIIKLEDDPIPNAEHCSQSLFEASWRWKQTNQDLSFKFITMLMLEIELFKHYFEPNDLSHEDAVTLIFGNGNMVEEMLYFYGLEYQEEWDLLDPLNDLVQWLTKQKDERQ